MQNYEAIAFVKASINASAVIACCGVVLTVFFSSHKVHSLSIWGKISRGMFCRCSRKERSCAGDKCCIYRRNTRSCFLCVGNCLRCYSMNVSCTGSSIKNIRTCLVVLGLSTMALRHMEHTLKCTFAIPDVVQQSSGE